MPHATVFDTTRGGQAAAGVDEPQAEAIVDTLHGAVTSHVATKSDHGPGLPNTQARYWSPISASWSQWW